jgi:hypothetical protein
MSNPRLPGFASFRRAQQSSKDQRGRGGPRAPWTAWSFAMNAGDLAAGRFLPVEAFILGQHGWPTNTCTCEWPGFEGRCVFCYYNERDDDHRKKYFKKVRTVMQFVDFRYSHWETNGDGKVDTHTCSEVDANPRRNRCRHCASTDPAIAKRHFGGRKRWELTDDQFAQVTDVYGRLQGVCLAGEGDEICGKRVVDVGYVCSDPECGAELISERQLESEDCSEKISNPMTCPECGREDYPMGVLICDSDEHEPVPGTLFDKAVEVACSGVTKGNNRTTKAYNFETGAWPWGPIQDDLKKFGFDDEAIEKMIEPDDMHLRYAPMRIKAEDFASPEEYVSAVLMKQAEVCKKPVPDEFKRDQNGQASVGRSTWRRGSRS